MGTTKMERKNILWLVSWYPNKIDPFDGDFIQRHARAAAIYNNIHVLFVKEVDSDNSIPEQWNRSGGLTEQIIYYPHHSQGILAKFINFITWRRHCMKAINEYMKKAGKPSYIHVHIPWKAGILALELKIHYKINYFVTEHWGIYNKKVADNITTKPYLVQQLWKRIFRESLSFISVSNYLGKGVNKFVMRKPFTIIPNVVDTSLFYYNEDKHPTFTFIHVSNMVVLKNVDGILEAFQKLVASGCDHCRLIMIGNRDDNYSKKAHKMGLLNQKVFFFGEVPYAEVAAEMQQSHCFVLNSHIENAPCVISEALCCGLPIISTKVGGIPEMITNENGILINPGSTKDLTQAMNKMLVGYSSFNKSEIARIALGKYGLTVISDAFQKIY